MHDLAVIAKIQKLAPIEGKDRIEMATVMNYNSIVEKGAYLEGDKVIYVFYDAIMPTINPATKKPDFEFLRKRCWSEKYQGFRIRPMKLGNSISEGLVLPLSMLPKSEHLAVGTVVTDKLGIRLYDPENDSTPVVPKKGLRKILCRYAFFRKVFKWLDIKLGKVKEKGLYPQWITKSDEDNIEKCFDSVVATPSKEYIITEKIEGQASTFAIDKKGKFKVYSHNYCVEEGAWYDYAKEVGMEKLLRYVCSYLSIDGIAIQGELIGPNIQNNIYGRDKYELYIYGGYHLDHTKLTWKEIKEISKLTGIPTVPYVRKGKVTTLEDMLKDCEGWSVLENPITKKPVDREGLVWRTFDGNTHFKCKSRRYKISWEKKCKNE